MRDVARMLVRFAGYGEDEVTIVAAHERVAEADPVIGGFQVPSVPEILNFDPHRPNAENVEATLKRFAELPSRADDTSTGPVLVEGALREYEQATAPRARAQL